VRREATSGRRGNDSSNAFNPPSFFNADKTMLVSGWTYADVDHQFDSHAASFAKGFADESNYTATHFWGNPRDAAPDSGFAEDDEAPSPTPVDVPMLILK
jgi:hypothetical protein